MVLAQGVGILRNQFAEPGRWLTAPFPHPTFRHKAAKTDLPSPTVLMQACTPRKLMACAPQPPSRRVCCQLLPFQHEFCWLRGSSADGGHLLHWALSGRWSLAEQSFADRLWSRRWGRRLENLWLEPRHFPASVPTGNSSVENFQRE